MQRQRKVRRLGRAARQAAFTLLELMVVISIILILLSLATVQYRRSLLGAKEAALRTDLRAMREAIEHYTLDKQTAPQTLDDLVSAGYLREIPLDPITKRKDWRVVAEDILLSPEQTSVGITDVHSASDAPSSDGSPYSSW